jgi:hypothetical protein
MTERRREFGWFGSSMTLIGGIVFLALTYAMYRDDAWQDEMAGYSPVVCMKITGRYRGAGTVKLPDEIYAEYKGKAYKFELGRKYFRRLMGVDTVAVYFDSSSGRAVLPTSSGRVRHYAFLYVMIAGMGVMLIGVSIDQFMKLAGDSRAEGIS